MGSEMCIRDSVEIQELLYLLKKAILEENTEEADDLADEIRELIELEG
mgnify:CR=1 FL=1